MGTDLAVGMSEDSYLHMSFYIYRYTFCFSFTR